MEQVGQQTTAFSQTNSPQVPPSPSPLAPKKPLKMLGIAALLIILSLIFGGYTLFIDTQAVKTTIKPSTSTSDQPANAITQNLKGWKTLESKACLLTMQYPADWEGKVSDGPTGCMLTVSSVKLGTAVILQGRRQEGAWENILSEYPNYKSITISGLEGIEIESKSIAINDMLATKAVTFRKNDVVFTLIFTYKPTVENILPIYEQMLASIQVTGDPQLTPYDPDWAFAKPRNITRESNVNTLLNAIGHYAADNNGAVPPGITSTPKTISSDGADICKYLYPTYIPALPVDPLINEAGAIEACPATYTTNYIVVKEGTKVTVSAPDAELGEQISVTR